MVVHGDDIALFDEGPANDVFRSTALMDGQKVFFSEHLFDGFLQPAETLGAGIGIVGLKHCRDLIVAHGIGAAVGQHVEEDITGVEPERIESGLLDGFETPFHRYEVQFLDYTHFMQFERNIFSAVKFDFVHWLANFRVGKSDLAVLHKSQS